MGEREGATSPGPWKCDDLGDDVLAADDEVVARKHWDVHEQNGSAARWRADRLLIASAPTLRDDLAEAVRLLREDYGECDPPHGARCPTSKLPGGCWCCRRRAFLSRMDEGDRG